MMPPSGMVRDLGAKWGVLVFLHTVLINHSKGSNHVAKFAPPFL